MIVGVVVGLCFFSKDVRIGVVDLAGVVFYCYYMIGELKGEGFFIIEGIGVGWIIGNLEGFEVDNIY